MKQFLTIPFLLLLANLAFAQAPSNDNCSGAITLTPITAGGVCPTDIYTNVNANDATGGTGSNNPSCFNGLRAFKDVWFKFTTPAATGSNLNYRVTVRGVTAADSIKNPQVAMYIGDCGTGLFEEYCATRLITRDTNSISLDAGCMRSNTTYYIQVGSFLSTDIGGRFTVCIEPIDPIYNMSPTPQTTTACVGTVYDSGGPNGNYGNSQSAYTFNIRPTATGCIELTIDSLSLEANFDSLVVFDGRTNRRLDRITGASNRLPIILQLRTDWVQLKFYSDGSVNSRGFKCSWRSLLVCNTPAPTSCAAPDIIPSLPFTQTGATTCNDDIDAVTTSPCTPASTNNFLQGKDHIYKYTSTGAQCIQVILTGIPTSTSPGTHTGANVGIYLGCPGTPGATCIKTGTVNTTRDTVFNSNVTLEQPGDYYFVVSRREACMPYNITIDTIPCLNRLPNAGSCARALTLNDCSNQNPSDIVLDLSVQGDSTFFTSGATNAGCVAGLGGVGRYNFVFLYFQAKADGKFGFTISPLGTDPSFDIDFNMYGPMDSLNQICSFTKNNAPIRSSYGVGTSTPNRSQGMVDSYINTSGVSTLVTDTCEGTGSILPDIFDGYVRRVDVKAGKYYALWINDFNGSVGRNGVRLNFQGTDNGVLNNSPVERFAAGRDTIICPGGTAQLFATGGITYKWKPSAGLNSDTASRPIARPAATTAYNVSIQGTCRIVPQTVNVGVFAIKPIADQTVCRGEELVFDAGITYPLSSGAVWAWTSPTGHLSELSCINCPVPNFRATNTTNTTETHTFIVSLTTPSCTLRDTITITVSSGQVAQYQVITSPKVTRDTNVCIGSTFALLKSGFDATATYTWASSPTSTLTGNNPSVSPTTTTKYYVTVTGGAGGCNAQSKDSVIINLFLPPTLTRAVKDTTLCKDEKIQIGKTNIQANTTYSWSNLVGLSSGTTPNPTVTVAAGRQVYILTASNPGGCISKDTMTVTGVNLAAKIDTVDSIRICRGVPLTLKTATTPLGLKVKWGSNKDFSIPTDSVASITVNPTRRTLYHITATMPGCTRRDSVEVYVDSLPTPTNILPQDTTVCQGTLILFRSPVFEPVLFPGVNFKWTPTIGTITADSLYNMVISADSTRTYRRLMINGVCRRTDSVKVNVNPNPVLTLLPRDTVICDKAVNSVTLRASSATPNTKDWKWTGPQGEIQSAAGQTTTIVTPSVGVNRYTVTAKVGDCPGSATTTITVLASPTVTFPADPTICKDSSIVLNTSPNSSYTYSWSGPSGFTSTASAPRVTPAASGSYSVTVTGSNNCSSTSSVTVNVATATLSVTPNTSICAGLPLTLTATASSNLPGGTIRWNTGATTASINPPTSVNGTYSVTYTYGNGKCSLSASTQVTSIPTFFLRISPDTFRANRLLDQGTPVTLNAILSGNVGTSQTFTWTSNGASLGTTQTVNIKPMNEGAYTVSVTSSTGCKKDTSVNIFIRYPKYELPNAFTPNGDTVNSHFGPIFNDLFPPAATDPRPRFWKGRIEVISFQVFNRWGSEIYSETNSTALNAATYKGWDGKKGTNDAASDVYVYIIKLRMPDDSIKVESGEVNLIR
ncbi:MAG: gliding motility-associated C-terminal domain-containing protein [Saprospiraceae bacterium]|nr:gliding motility-associated C-terminal domain-containing protein [Saprospiraceae bacterium]